MKLKEAILILTLSLIFSPLPYSQACSTFGFTSPSGKVIAAKNYDWFFFHGHGAVFVYPRETFRTSFTQPDQFHWSSKYGSVTFTQFGKGLPIGGMNEKGLVVEMLQLDETAYPESHPRSLGTVNESQWTEYQLDQYATTQEVIDHIQDLAISKTFIGIHYFIMDASGQAAVIEFLDGTPHVYTQDNLPVAAITNTPYSQSTEILQTQPSLKLKNSIWFQRSSESRFSTLASFLNSTQLIAPGEEVSSAFRALQSVCLNGSSWDAPCEPTQWSIVYDISEKQIHFKSRSNPKFQTLSLKNLDWSSLKQIKVWDMQSSPESSGREISLHLKTYTPDFNAELIHANRWLIPSQLRDQAILHGQRDSLPNP